MNYYHVYNRGAYKEIIFRHKNDMFRFLDGLVFFNNTEKGDRKMIHTPVKNRRNQTGQTCLVVIHAYCLLPNHFHLFISCEDPSALSKFMQKLGSGYSGYFNEKYTEHSGTVFQGRYKKVIVETDEQLHTLFAYINMNNELHTIENGHFVSSLLEYFTPRDHVLTDTSYVQDNFTSQQRFNKYCSEKITYTKKRRREAAEYWEFD